MIYEMKGVRKYRMKERAKSQARTRMRIVNAAVSLHQEQGVGKTTISDIADRAGVERLTVYRHFPDELSLVHACSAHWLDLNPFPQPSLWNRIADPIGRTHLALVAFYRYFRQTEAMWNTILKEEHQVSAVEVVLKPAHEYFATVIADLAEAWPCKGAQRRKLIVAITHSIEFHAWQSFKTQGLNDIEIADLMILWFTALSPSRQRKNKLPRIQKDALTQYAG